MMEHDEMPEAPKKKQFESVRDAVDTARNDARDATATDGIQGDRSENIMDV